MAEIVQVRGRSLMTEGDAHPEIIAIQRRHRAASGAAGAPDYAMSPECGVVDDGRPALILWPPTEIAAFGFHEQWNAIIARLARTRT
jgi:hypothetical protein